MAVKLAHGKAVGMLSLTSLIDVVFLLLIFFLVATKFAEEDEQTLDVQLPTASEAKPLTSRPKEIIVSLDAQGRYFIKGSEMTLVEMEDYLRRAAIDNPLGQEVKVRADKRAQVQSIVHVFNACNKAGISSYKISTGDEAGG